MKSPANISKGDGSRAPFGERVMAGTRLEAFFRAEEGERPNDHRHPRRLKMLWS